MSHNSAQTRTILDPEEKKKKGGGGGGGGEEKGKGTLSLSYTTRMSINNSISPVRDTFDETALGTEPSF